MKKAVMMAVICSLSLMSVSDALSSDMRGEVRKLELGMMETGDYSEAALRLAGILAENPDDPSVSLALGLAEYGRMDYRNARDHIALAADLGVRERDDLARYALSVIDANRALLDGMEALNASLPKGPSPDRREEIISSLGADHVRMVAELLRGDQYYPALVTAHINWIKLYSPEAYPGIERLSAEIKYSAMLYASAVKDFEKAAEDDPLDPELLRSYGDCLTAIGDLDKAGEVYGKAAELYRAAGGKAEIAKAENVERIRAALPRTYKEVSDLIDKGHYSEAEAHLRRRLSLNGADPIAVLQLGVIRWKQGKRNEAMRFFSRAAAMAPDHPMVHFYLGKGYVFANDMKRAENELRLFEEKMKRIPVLDEGTGEIYVSAMLYFSHIYSTRKEYGKVLEVSKKVLEVNPLSQDALYNMAIANYYLHKPSAAYEGLREVVEVDPDSDTAKMAEYCIEYLRSNPDPRVRKDFSFIYRD
ncbi:MAG: tetratricopeptide repeat protein [Candidatus Omnitrophica bacterium]|nr:tetratricopeptide repeat protein [Candidatus Omnitrophota bacterium]